MNWLLEFLSTIDTVSTLLAILMIAGFWNINIKLNHLKELLSNHVTDTTKKIDDTKTEMKEGQRQTDKKYVFC